LNKPLEALYYAARWTNVVFLKAFFETSAVKANATGGVVSGIANMSEDYKTFEEDKFILDMI
jgi:hypothetical protein